MGKKEKIPAPGARTCPYTNFFSKAKWKQMFTKSSSEPLSVPGRNLRGPGMMMVANAITKNKTLLVVDFSANHLGDEGAIHIAQLLKLNDTIQVLNVASNEITDIGGIAIASAFIPAANPTGQPSQWNRALCEIDLSGNKLKDDTLVAMCNAAACSRDLMVVNLEHNEIGPQGCRALKRALQRNPRCNFMLGGNELGDEGCMHFCLALKQYGRNCCSTLNMSRNDISKDGGEAIGDLLMDNDYIKEVDLSYNTLGFKGTQLLCERMRSAKNAVTRLTLCDNMLDDAAAEEVAKLIETSPEKLTAVLLQNNSIGDKGAIALGKAMAKNVFIKLLSLNGNQISGRHAIEELAHAATPGLEPPPPPPKKEGEEKEKEGMKQLRKVEVHRNDIEDTAKVNAGDAKEGIIDYGSSEMEQGTTMREKLQVYTEKKVRAEREKKEPKKKKK